MNDREDNKRNDKDWSNINFGSGMGEETIEMFHVDIRIIQ